MIEQIHQERHREIPRHREGEAVAERGWIWCVIDKVGLTVLNPDWVVAASYKAGELKAQDTLTLTIAMYAGDNAGEVVLRGAEARRVWDIVRTFAPDESKPETLRFPEAA